MGTTPSDDSSSRITEDTELIAVIAAAGESRKRSLSSDPASTLYISD